MKIVFLLLTSALCLADSTGYFTAQEARQARNQEIARTAEAAKHNHNAKAKKFQQELAKRIKSDSTTGFAYTFGNTEMGLSCEWVKQYKIDTHFESLGYRVVLNKQNSSTFGEWCEVEVHW